MLSRTMSISHPIDKTKQSLPDTITLVRTSALIECYECYHNNTKYVVNCVKCNTKLSTRPDIWKVL